MIHTPKERPDLVLHLYLNKFFKIWSKYYLYVQFKNLKLKSLWRNPAGVLSIISGVFTAKPVLILRILFCKGHRSVFQLWFGGESSSRETTTLKAFTCLNSANSQTFSYLHCNTLSLTNWIYRTLNIQIQGPRKECHHGQCQRLS